MKNELEKVHGSDPQDTVDAANGDATRGRFEESERSESSKGFQSQRGRRQASTRGGFEKFEEFESSRGCQSKQESPSEPLKPLEPLEPLELDKLEERFRKECRKSCRRNFWIELLKTAGKIAGVILAAFGLSSFNEEN